MPWSNIWNLLKSAMLFASAVLVIFFSIRTIYLKKTHRTFSGKQEIWYAIFVFYIAALIQITVIRLGIHVKEYH